MARKGSSYEREFCKAHSLWWSGGKRDDLFWRSSMSGGRATVRSRKRLQTAGGHGDIVALDPTGEPWCDVFTTELKRGYGKAHAADVIDKGPGCSVQLLEQFFTQAYESHQSSSSVSWALVVKRDHRKEMIYMPYWISIDLGLRKQVKPWQCLIFNSSFPRTRKGKKTDTVKETITGMLLETFYSSFTPQTIKDISKGY